MDLYIYEARNRETFKHEYWRDPTVYEVFYARKYWELVNHCTFIPKDYESGDPIELTIENIEEMIKVATQYRDYFDTYNNVPKLCELRDLMHNWEEIEERDKHLYLMYDW